MRIHPLGRVALFGLPVALLVGALSVSSGAAGTSVAAATATPVVLHTPRVAAKHHGKKLSIKTLSSRADLVSGNEVLTRISIPKGTKAKHLHVKLNGTGISHSFKMRPDNHIEGLVKNLDTGHNKLVAKIHGEKAKLPITDYRSAGPLFSGPEVQPWKCENHATNSRCARSRSTIYLYAPAGTAGVGVTNADESVFRAYHPSDPPAAASIATAQTTSGVEVPFIVREITGYLDRDQYTIATLWQPGQQWKPWAPQAQFNHRMVITHGASCNTAYGAGAAPSVLDPQLVGGGFVVMSNALDNAGHNCDLVTQAESLVMTKQYAIDHYGPVQFTIGTGCSGGSTTQQQVANAYPGIYQGITPACSFPDAFSTGMDYLDYQTLLNYFATPSEWSPDLKWPQAAVEDVLGNEDITQADFDSTIPDTIDPSRSCPGVPASKVFHPKSNPNGLKCDLQNYMVNVFGVKAHGFANRETGNDGVQYGLQSLLNGGLTPRQFVDVNSKVGGITQNDTFRSARNRPDPLGLKRAYRSGAVNVGNNLNDVAIIDLRGPDDGFWHAVYRTAAMRSRLQLEFGTAANQVLWRGADPKVGDVNYTDEAVMSMNQWLHEVHKDKRDVPLATKIIQDKPTDLTARCTNGDGTSLPESVCDKTVPLDSSPRLAAGLPAAYETLQCQLVPLQRSSYPHIRFTKKEWSELQKAFPQGVCNYAKPGVDFRGTVPWLTYQNHKGNVVFGGKPLGPAPTSVLIKK